MITNYTRGLYDRAIKRWGGQAQLRMLQEECGELIVAVAHVLRKNKSLSTTELADEIADVEIMCEQARVLLGDEGSDLVDRAKDAKLRRLQARLEASS